MHHSYPLKHFVLMFYTIIHVFHFRDVLGSFNLKGELDSNNNIFGSTVSNQTNPLRMEFEHWVSENVSHCIQNAVTLLFEVFQCQL